MLQILVHGNAQKTKSKNDEEKRTFSCIVNCELQNSKNCTQSRDDLFDKQTTAASTSGPQCKIISPVIQWSLIQGLHQPSNMTLTHFTEKIVSKLVK